MRQTPSDQSHHLHLHIGFANVNGKGIAEATWNFGGRSQGRWNKGLSYIIYQRAQIFGEDPSPIPRTSPYFRACVEVWDGIRMGSATSWNRRHLKSFEITWNPLESFSKSRGFGGIHREAPQAACRGLCWSRSQKLSVSVSGWSLLLVSSFFATTMSFLPSAPVHF